MKRIYLLFLMVLFGTFMQAQTVATYAYAAGTTGALDAMTGSTQLVAANQDDAASVVTGIGFSFTYAGTAYTQFSANSNGLMRLGATAVTTSFSNTAANAASATPAIFPYWDDLATGTVVGGGKVHYLLTGSAPNRILKVEWFVTVPISTAGAANAKFQCWLYETTNVVQFIYGSGMVTNTLNSGASVGLATTATVYNNVVVSTGLNSTTTFTATNTAAITAGQTYTFTPPVPCTGTPTPGTVAPATQNVCPTTTPAALVLTGFSSGVTGITFQWEQAADAAFTASVANAVGGTGATTATYTPPTFAGTNIYYRCKVTCTPSTLFATSTVASVLTPAAPATQASAIVGVANNTTATINWTNGNGGRRFVVVNTTNTFTDPVGTADVTGITTVYTSGEVKVYDGTASTVSITGLVAGQTYFVRVYEYLRCTGAPNVNYYNVATATNNPNSFVTYVVPANDECTGAVNLTPQAYVPLGTCPAAPVVTGTTLGATLSSSTAPPTTAFTSSNDDDVWYDFTATATSHIVRLCNVTFPIGTVQQMGIVVTNGCLSTNTEIAGTPTGSLITLTSGSGEMLFNSLTIGTTYKVRVLTGSTTSRANFEVSILNLPPMTYVSSTTTQPNTTAVVAGSTNQDIIRLEITVNGSTSPLSVSQIDFNTTGTTLPANITNARVFYTGTSTTFTTTTPFGTATATPSGSFSATGTQVLTGALANTVNYFWLAYDVSCTAVNPNVVDAECTGFNIGTAKVPTATAPPGSRTITTFAYSLTRTDGNAATAVPLGTQNAQFVYSLISGSATCPGNVTTVNFTATNPNATDVVNAKCYYTTTSTFSSAVQYGTSIANPATGLQSFTGSQILATGNNYFWVVYDINCSGTAGASVNADINSLVVSGNTVLVTGTATGANLLSVLYTPTRTDGNGTTAVQLGTQNAQFVYSLISGSATCPGTVTTVNFTPNNTNLLDVVNAKCYYTTTSAFSSAVQFGSSIANPANVAQSFTGSQLLATGNNYFWVVYDINCSGTAGASVNADINSLVVSGNTVLVTGTATGANALAAITNYTTVADGEWSNTATWACGNLPPSNTTPVIIAHQVTVSNTGNIGGNVTINTGKSLTVNSGGDLMLGTVGGGNRTLTSNGTLSVLGGTLTQNGNVILSSGSTFNQSAGSFIVDGNGATSVASAIVLFLVNTNIGLVNGGTLTIVDPPATGTARSFTYSLTSSTSWAGHSLKFGDGVSSAASTNTSGFQFDTYASSGELLLGNVVVDAGNTTNRWVTTSSASGNGSDVGGNLTVNSGSELRNTTGGTGIVVGGNIVNNGTLTISTYLALGTLSGTTFIASAIPQSISGSGIFRDALTTPNGNLFNFQIFNSSASGVTLSVPLIVSSTLTMNQGRINTTTTNLLTLGYNATSATTAGTLTYTAGHIVGPFKRWITTVVPVSRQFPMGDGTNLKNAVINFTGAPTAGSLTAIWSSLAPTPNPALMEGALVVDKVSAQGSWFVDAADGLTGGTYTGTFTANGSSDIVDNTKTVLIKRPSSGGAWILDGIHVTTTGTNIAPVLNRTGMSGFSEFAIGGANTVVLPISIQYLRGSKIAATNFLDWKVSCTSQPSVQLTLERSADGRSFTAIDAQNATATRCLQGFNYTDNNPLAGFNYYRLKTTSPDGKVSYSTIVVLLNKEKGFELISLAPNPVRNTATLSLTTVKGGKIDINVSDIAGKVISTQSVVVIAGNNPINMNFAALGAGTYIITAVNAEGELKTTRFVKF